MKNVYLIVTDLHMNDKKDNRLNYFSEVLESLDQINEIKESYKAKGYRVILFLLGDVVDRSIDNADTAMLIQNVLRFFANGFDDTLSVVGNHETTYITANPFWHLINEVKAQSLSGLFKAIQSKGLEPIITVPETVEDGNVTFYFNHYGVPPIVPKTSENHINIGLFHQAVGSLDICKMYGTFTDANEAAFLTQYNYSFFAHMHMAFGKYWLNPQHTSRGEWLGSIGRCNVPEVTDTALTRNIPAVCVVDGNFESIEDNTITLSAAPNCVDLVRYRAEQATREIIKARQAITPHKDLSISMYESIERACASSDLLDVLDMCKARS